MSRAVRLDSVDPGNLVRISCDGETLECRAGKTIGVALLATGRRRLRTSPRRRQPRGLFCAMGVCFECLVEVDGRDGVRACLTPVREGMVVRTTPLEPGA